MSSLEKVSCRKVKTKAFDIGYDRKRKSKKQEERIAKILQGKVVRASGAGRMTGSGLGAYGSKGDAVSLKFLAEAKRTDLGSIRITIEWLDKIYREALGVGKRPMLTLEFGLAKGISKDWILLTKEDFSSLLGDKHD